MRIIAGKYRGRRLKSPPTPQTRPTSDRLRETLFNILAPQIDGARFLDLCAGSGAVGIEALSRGAEHVVFVDHSRKMCALIEANIASLKIAASEVEIVPADASGYLRKQVNEKAFDIIFFDPPYASDYESVLSYIGMHAHTLLEDQGMIIVEHSSRNDLADKFGSLNRYRTVKQGDSSLSFYEISCRAD